MPEKTTNMKEHQYIDFLETKDLRYCESSKNCKGTLIWGVSLDRKDRLVVHDCSGKAYIGGKTMKDGLFTFRNFCPAYGNKVLSECAIDIRTIKLKRIIQQIDGRVVWGVSLMRNGRYIVVDYYDRTFLGLEIREGEDLMPECFTPAFKGKPLKPYPRLNIKTLYGT